MTSPEGVEGSAHAKHMAPADIAPHARPPPSEDRTGGAGAGVQKGENTKCVLVLCKELSAQLLTAAPPVPSPAHILHREPFPTIRLKQDHASLKLS